MFVRVIECVYNSLSLTGIKIFHINIKKGQKQFKQIINIKRNISCVLKVNTVCLY